MVQRTKQLLRIFLNFNRSEFYVNLPTFLKVGNFFQTDVRSFTYDIILINGLAGALETVSGGPRAPF